MEMGHVASREPHTITGFCFSTILDWGTLSSSNSGTNIAMTRVLVAEVSSGTSSSPLRSGLANSRDVFLPQFAILAYSVSEIWSRHRNVDIEQ